ncbi:hypothetical protein DAI22_11g244300 [Oryza sativa Japonica Group]|nr:hypothetical protein DAI22_11g244300 [Oryza sativa Japonica Group]
MEEQRGEEEWVMWGSAGRRRIIRQSASWEEQAFARDAAANANLGGCVWPPRFYTCSFCQREFRSAQALGGHMNVHRRDRARLRQRQTSSSSSPSHQEEEAEAPQDQQAGPYYTSFSKPSTTSTDNTTCSNDILLLARDQETIKKRVPRQQVQVVADQDEDEPAGRRYKRRRLGLVDQLPSSCEGGDHHHQGSGLVVKNWLRTAGYSHHGGRSRCRCRKIMAMAGGSSKEVDEEKQTEQDRWKGLAYDISDDQQDITRGKGLVDSLFQAPMGDGTHEARVPQPGSQNVQPGQHHGHISKNLMKLPNIQGKSFQCDLVFAKMGIK